jgi:ketol-acid reductoisomerase
MGKNYHGKDADLPLIEAKKVAIISYGSQGHVYALNLKDAGVDVRVGLRPDCKDADRARNAGLVVETVAEVSSRPRLHLPMRSSPTSSPISAKKSETSPRSVH